MAHDLPWLDADPSKRVQKLFRLPADLSAMLRWVAGSTYGESEQSIAERAIRRELAHLMRAKGVPARHWKSRLEPR